MLLSLCAAASCKTEYYTPKFNGGENGGSSTVTPGKGTGLHTIGEILPYTTVNSHAGEEKWSVLQPMWNDFSVVPHSYLIDQSLPEAQRTVYYTRIKKMANGRYLMLYMGGELGSRCYATTSDDLLKWSTPELLLEPVQETVAGASDWIRYSGPDAVVLPNGDVLAVFSFRANNHYSQGIGCGLVTMRSRNNGLTWSAPQKIHDGPTWEPYLLVLPDGRIQCYFTDPIPMTKNSGTSVLVSSDNGQTWTPKIRCSRMYKYDYVDHKTIVTS